MTSYRSRTGAHADRAWEGTPRKHKEDVNANIRTTQEPLPSKGLNVLTGQMEQAVPSGPVQPETKTQTIQQV